jgi:voltage-gated potassium channel Kch
MPTPALLRLASKAPSHPWTRWAVGCFSGAFESMHVSFEACEVERRQLGEDVARAARGRASQWARDFGLLLPAFLAIGIAAYRHYEGFSTFDTLYYITATVTTVGYGDFHPATQAGRLFTAVYAPFGVVVVMSGLLPLVHTLLEAIDGWTAALVWANERAVLAVVEQTRRLICGCAAPSSRVPQTVVLRGLDLRLERRVYIVGASAAYVHALLSPLLLFSLGVLLATVVQRYTLIDAIYWLSITMTTIGYGDLVPSTWVEKLYTMLLMLLASTAVAATVGKFEKLRTASRIHRTNFRVRLMELMHASAVKLNVSEPTIAEEAFVVRTLVDFGLVEEETIDEIRERFREISGRSSEDREQGVATINLRHLYANLVKQGRVLDANIVAANALGQRKRTANAAEADRRRKAADAAAQARARARQLLFSGASTIPATPAPIAVEEQTPARLSHNGVPAVDMSTGDHGYSEWLELVWIPSLPTTADASGAERPWVLPASLPVSDRARGRVEGATKPREGEGMRGVAPPSSGGIAAMLRKKSREASPMPRPAPLPAPQVRRGYTRLTDATSELDA